MTVEWEGPRNFELSKDTEHTDTVRYRCPVGSRELDFYAPRALIGPEDTAAPNRIFVEISRSEMALHEIGFHGHPIRPRTEADYWEYELHDDNLVHSVRYAVEYEGHRFSLYMPRDLFEDRLFPKRLLVFIGIPED